MREEKNDPLKKNEYRRELRLRKRLRAFLSRMTPIQVIIAYYVVAVSVSTILLSLPMTKQKGVHVSFIDTLFTAASSVSVTGLSSVDVHHTYSTFGIWILMGIFQIGGLGVMMLSTFFYLILRRRIGLKQRQLIMTDTNQFSMSGMVRMLRDILVLIFGIELLGTLILGIYFIPHYQSIPEAMFQGLYNSVSLVTNAGVDITGHSLMPFANDYFVQIISILLIMAGAIGFPVLLETKKILIDQKCFDPVSLFLICKSDDADIFYFADWRRAVYLAFGIQAFLCAFQCGRRIFQFDVFVGYFAKCRTRNDRQQFVKCADIDLGILLDVYRGVAKFCGRRDTNHDICDHDDVCVFGYPRPDTCICVW